MRRRLVLSVCLVGVAAGCGAKPDTGQPATATSATTTPARPASGKPVLCGSLRESTVGRVGDNKLKELSGIVRSRATRGLLFSHEDSGGGPVVYEMREDGSVVAEVKVAGAEAVDWEDIAAAPSQDGTPTLYVGDIGDNDASRASIDVYRVAEPAPGATETAPSARIQLRYPDGPHDAEALLADPIRHELVIVTKEAVSGHAYSVPSDTPPGSQTALRRGPAIDLSLVTAGDVSADGRIVALRNYDELAVWKRRGREPLTTTLSRPPCISRTSLRDERQGEGLALNTRGTVALTVTEGKKAQLRRYTP
jgi:hypothetical protein